MATELAIEESLLGNWPRRLLHVPTMISYEWQAGNVYGGFTSPSYNAITYTWGRWKLGDDEQLESLPLTIHGVNWDLPRVNRDHFTSDMLHMMLLEITQNSPSPQSRHASTDHTMAPAEFVWLDIACIDQRIHEPKSAAEVGRQAAIFRGASNVYIWLSRTSDSVLKPALEELHHLVFSIKMIISGASPKDVLARDKVERIRDRLSLILVDPWFSSLWTLQEAFLCPNAWMIGREADSAMSAIHEDPSIRTLHHLLELCRLLSANYVAISEPPREPYEEALNIMRSTGMLAMTSGSALAVYGASAYRQATLNEDRIYGIQQIFGFRLGNSGVATGPIENVPLRELEFQFGKHLLESHPVLSQMHVFPKPAPVGSSWLLSKMSLTPLHLNADAADVVGLPSQRSERASCKLSVRKVEGTTWATFEGLVCDYVHFSTICTVAEDIEGYTLIFTYLPRQVTLYLDATSELPPLDETLDDVEYRHRGNKRAEWLAKVFPDDQLKVLLLGSRTGNNVTLNSTVMIGLLLLRKDSLGLHHHRRLGFCSWHVNNRLLDDNPKLLVLEGSGPLWVKAAGLFG
ncbi:hypothetical protein F4782DRAFT_509091 [Xylaria castorea]|nr:hypothetical protein F4782DRAFT_509091 [Xylaria castorea]